MIESFNIGIWQDIHGYRQRELEAFAAEQRLLADLRRSEPGSNRPAQGPRLPRVIGRLNPFGA